MLYDRHHEDSNLVRYDTRVDPTRAREKHISTTILSLVTLIMMVGFVWAFTNYRSAQAQIDFLSAGDGSTRATQKEIDQLVRQVRAHILLSQGVEPTVATVQDAASLAARQRFFSDAQNGDKILIYPDRAILFRAEQDVIINVAPVQVAGKEEPGTMAEGKEDASAALTSTESITIEIRNGGDAEGAAQRVAASIGTDRYRVVAIGNAIGSDYTGTTLVTNTDIDLRDLEERFGVSAVDILPEGETATTTDVLIIIGN